jgi:hypothetical protein
MMNFLFMISPFDCRARRKAGLHSFLGNLSLPHRANDRFEAAVWAPSRSGNGRLETFPTFICTHWN